MIKRNVSRFVGMLTIAIAIQPAMAQTDLSKFPLTRAIPADVFIAVAARGNAERDFLDAHWHRVFKAFHESGVVGDVWEMISDAMDDEQVEKVDEIREKFSGLCKDVNWGELFAKESVHAGRYVLPAAGSPYEGILLGRLDKEKSVKAYGAVKAIMEELVRLIEANGGQGMAVTEIHKDDFTMAVFGPSALPSLGVAVGYWKDVIIFGFGGLGMMEDSVKLLKGSKDVKALVDSERFKGAFAKLPPAEDELVFWDMSNMFGQVKTMVGGIGNHGGPSKKAAANAKPAKAKAKAADDDADDEDAKPSKAKSKKPANDEADDEEADDDEEDEGPDGGAIIAKALDEVSFIDFMASVRWTDGHSVHSESYTTLLPGAKDNALCKVFTGQEPVKNYERFIPKEAKNFSVGNGCNWTQLYHAIRDFVSENIPDGPNHIAHLDSMQADQWNLNIEKDILSLFAGGYVSVETGNDMVFMLKVTDVKRMGAQLDRLFAFVTEKAGKEGGLVISEVEIAGNAGFRQFSHPMLMMMGGGVTPVIGCAEGYLCIGTSTKGLKMVLETAAGKHANITKSEQFMNESVRPKSGALESISFEDETGKAEQIQSAIGAISMALGMAGMFGQDMPPEIRGFLTKVPPLLAKLGPVAGKLDFFQSTSSYTTFENGAWRERSVQNYKGPRPPDAEEDEAKTTDDAKPAHKKAAAPKKKPKPAADEDEDE
ncbi:MAG: hypothetical protein HZA51_04650 [Planctomycetes bacterium]|nr:hypothetical protein [Planctomycetota bacterium]